MIYFVGPLPPPLHGFSFVTAAMLAKFSALCSVTVFDRAPSGNVRAISRVTRHIGTFTGFVRALHSAPRVGVLYVGLSGGYGQLLDVLYIVAARLAGCPVVVHHHSFAYLCARKWYTVLCLGQQRVAHHIVLCERMAALLSSAYGIARNQIDIVSNAAFLPAADAGCPGFAEQAPPTLRLGFLSNITPEKGIFVFFELGAALTARGIPIDGVVAGPVAVGIKRQFQETLERNPWCRHVGAVYGADKESFFASIDVLMFPTLYANEAEPVTILEALRMGVPVVANERGCIRDLVPAGAGTVFNDDLQFVALAVAQLEEWYGEPGSRWAMRRTCASLAFESLHADHARRVDTITRQLTGSTVARAPA